MSHTPGPWAWRDERTNLGTPYPEGFIAIEAGPDYNPEQIASVVPNTFDGHPLANARLIAAAPDLLDATAALLDFAIDPAQWSPADVARFIEVGRAAVNKATGVSVNG